VKINILICKIVYLSW